MPTSKFVASFTYTDQELLDLFRECLARISVAGQEYEIAGRKFSAANLSEVREAVAYYERRVNAATYGLVQNRACLQRHP